MAAPRKYEFGEFRLDTAEQTLTQRDGRRVPLTPRAFATLRALVERPGELLDRATLMDVVWPNLVVEDNNLDQQISLLRQALGERRGVHRYVVTVPGRGYRFAEAVRAVDDEPAAVARATVEAAEGAAATASEVPRPAVPPANVPRWRLIGAVAVAASLLAALIVFVGRDGAEQVVAGSRPTLAVLPFKPMTAADGNESLEFGIAETLIVGLNGSRLTVSPLSSVRRFAGADQDALAAGRALGVDAVLESYIQRSGDSLRVSTRLLNVADGRQLWSQRYDERFSDILTIQDAIATRILRALVPNLGGAQAALRRYTGDAEAYQLYLDGQFYRRRASETAIREALGRFQRAVERDPGFALAYVGLADCYTILAVFGIEAPHAVFPRAREALDRALALAPDIAEAHASLGHYRMQYELDWPGAERALRRAIELDPSYAPGHQWLGLLLGYSGRFDEALEHVRTAQSLEPAAPLYAAVHGMLLSYQGRDDEAVAQLERTLAMAPDMPNTRTFLAMALIRQGKLERAAEVAATIASPAPGSRGYVGQIHALAGRRAEARDEIGRLIALSRESYVPAYDIASVYATLGDVEQSLAWLERAFEERSQIVAWLPFDRAFDGIRADKRYVELARRLPASVAMRSDGAQERTRTSTVLPAST